MKSKTFSVIISTVDKGTCKRSLTIGQIELLFLVCADCKLINFNKKYFDLRFTFYGGDFNRAVTVKWVPLGYWKKFDMHEI